MICRPRARTLRGKLPSGSPFTKSSQLPEMTSVEHVEAMTSDERCLVMTHDHHLDYRLVSAILTRTEVDFVGLIGSETKSKRFISKLRKEGLSDEDLARCVCPIGLSSVKGKLPMEIAVSVAAQLLSLDPVANSDLKPAISWKEIRAAFSPSL